MKTESVAIETVVPYARNPRKNESAVAKVAASIKEFGFKQPIVVDKDRVIVAGHTRLLAAMHLKMKQVPVLVADDLSDTQIKAYRLADNRVGQEAQWDYELLNLELTDLLNLDYDLAETGFDQMEIESIMADKTSGLTDPDEIPDAPDPITKPGDVWLLGAHRLVCGDCTDPLVVDKALNGVKPHLMVTDPPYGVEYDASWRSKAMPKKNDAGRWTEKDGRAKGKVLNDDRADWSEAWALFPGDVAYIWHGSLQTSIVVDSLAAAAFAPRSLIIWAKSHFAIGRGDYHPMHEPCWYAVREGKTGHYVGDRKQTTLWQIDKPHKSETGHSTQKPVECMRRPIVNNSSPGQAVYEPFSGSGTTIIAGEMEGRSIHAIEIDPGYCDIAVKRWENFTGKAAQIERREAA